MCILQTQGQHICQHIQFIVQSRALIGRTILQGGRRGRKIFIEISIVSCWWGWTFQRFGCRLFDRDLDAVKKRTKIWWLDWVRIKFIHTFMRNTCKGALWNKQWLIIFTTKDLIQEIVLQILASTSGDKQPTL